MSTKKRAIPLALTTCYAQKAGSSDFVLYSGPIRVVIPTVSKPPKGRGQITFSWLPKPGLKGDFKVTTNPKVMFSLPDEVTIGFGRRRIGPLLPTHTKWKSEGTLELGGPFNAFYETSTRTRLTSVRFHLANAPNSFGEPIRTKAGSFWRGRVLLSGNGWIVTLDTIPSHKKTYDNLRMTGGSALTHIGRFKRVNGREFSVGEAKSILLMLRYFFAMCIGREVGPFLPVGYDKKGKIRWQWWASHIVRSYQGTLSWCNFSESVQLKTLFPGFSKRWANSQDALRLCLSWYLEAQKSEPSLEPRIVSLQTALERLCYEIIVLERGALSANGLSRLDAHDQIRLLLSFLGADVTIPPQLRELGTYAKTSGCQDGAECLTRIRNRVTHGDTPQKKKASRSAIAGPVLRQTWAVGRYYVELALLHFCGYKGQLYNNTVRPGTTIATPW